MRKSFIVDNSPKHFFATFHLEPLKIFVFWLQIVVTDLRTVSFDVPPQEILTKDSVTVSIDAVVYYKIGMSHALKK